MVEGRFQKLVLGAVLAVIIGWVLYVGKSIFVPIVFSVLIAYIIVGGARALERLPAVGPRLPVQLRYTVSILGIALVLAAGVLLVVANINKLVEVAPEYQETMLEKVQQLAVFFDVEAAESWTVLREDVLEGIDLQAVVGSALVSVTGAVAGILVVMLYVVFLLIEQRVFPAKLANLTDSPRSAARLRQIISSINSRTGQYLALKTLINVLLGFTSWVIMAVMGVEFAAFWAVLIAVLNYVPYIGSFLGVLFPVALALVQFDELSSVLVLLSLLVAAQFAIGNFLDPFLMGNSLNLSPFVVLASLAVWGGLWGIPGAFLAVPISAVLVIVFSEFRGTRPIAVLLSRNGEIDPPSSEATDAGGGASDVPASLPVRPQPQHS